MNDTYIATAANSNTTIIVDEIGLDVGVFGDFRLKTAFRPVFRRLDGNQIEPFAVEGSYVPFLRGKAVGAEEFKVSLTPADLAPLEQLARVLILRNLHHLDVGGLSIFVPTDLGSLDPDQPWSAHLGQPVDQMARFICAIAAASLLDRHDLIEQTLTLRAAGFGVAISGFGMGPWDIACMQAVRPDIVRIDASWFQRVAANPSAAKLLNPLVAGLHDQGTEVLIEGIDRASELQVALGSGVDFLQGDLLGRPALAGSIFDLSRRRIDGLLGRDGNEANVVPLFA